MLRFDVSYLLAQVYGETLESLTRLGCDAILVSDKLYAGSDTIATTKVLGKVIALLKPDLILKYVLLLEVCI